MGRPATIFIDLMWPDKAMVIPAKACTVLDTAPESIPGRSRRVGFETRLCALLQMACVARQPWLL